MSATPATGAIGEHLEGARGHLELAFDQLNDAFEDLRAISLDAVGVVSAEWDRIDPRVLVEAARECRRLLTHLDDLMAHIERAIGAAPAVKK